MKLHTPDKHWLTDEEWQGIAKTGPNWGLIAVIAGCVGFWVWVLA